MTIPVTELPNAPEIGQSIRVLTAVADVSTIRVAQFHERQHLVVPVIALIGDHVYRPMNSDGGEFIPLSELQTAPSCWDGRPVVPDHPTSGAQSANTPEQLENAAFGVIFNSRVEDGKLKMDAWLDVERANSLGGNAASVISRVRAGKMVEISIGARTILDRRPGRTADGVAYTYVWRGVWPDHLAALPEDATGACSVDAGCGLPRAARSLQPPSDRTSRSLKEIRAMSELVNAPAAIRLAALNTVSDSELRASLEAALFGTEPGFQGVVEVFPEENYVVFYAMDAQSNFHIYRTKYAIGEDKAVSFSRRTEVKAVTKYEAMEGGTIDGTITHEPPHDCKCGKHLSTSAGIAASLSTEGGNMSTEANVAATSASDPNAVIVLSTTGTALGAGSTTAIEPVIEPAAAVEPEPVGDVDLNSVSISTEELQSLRAMAAQYEAIVAAEKSALVKALAAHPKIKPVFTVEQLNSKSIPELQSLAKITDVSVAATPAAPVNFTLIRTPADVDPDAESTATDPKPWSAALLAKGLKAVS